MILIPVCLLAAFPPGFLFPQMAARMAGPVGKIRIWKASAKEAKAAKKSSGNGDASAGEEVKETKAVEPVAEPAAAEPAAK